VHREKKAPGAHGDNQDDSHSGKIDVVDDGNSGQGDDNKTPIAADPQAAQNTPSDPKDHKQVIPGDNQDDAHSEKVDCIGDGDSGQGNDARKCQTSTPAPGPGPNPTLDCSYLNGPCAVGQQTPQGCVAIPLCE